MIGRLRRQPPAYSPVSLHAVGAALAGVAREPGGLRSRLATFLCQTFGARDALLVGSGTTALRLALTGLGATGPRRLMALPAYGCFDIATAADGADVRVVLYDLDPRTLGADPQSLTRALERQPTALVVAHLYGYPVDMHGLARLCHDAGTVLIEDAAQGAGGTLGGKPLGSFGSLSVLSFGRGKGTSAGAGGALLAHDEVGAQIVAWAADRLPAAARGVREAALLAAQWALGRPALYWLPAAIPFLRLGETVYVPPRAPSGLTSAALTALSVGLPASAHEVERRRSVATRLLARARASVRVDAVEPIGDAVPGFLRLPLRANRISVAVVVKAIGRFGVVPAYPRPLSALRPFGNRLVNSRDGFSGAQMLAETLLTFPTHRLLTRRDLTTLEEWLGEAPEALR